MHLVGGLCLKNSAVVTVEQMTFVNGVKMELPELPEKYFTQILIKYK